MFVAFGYHSFWTSSSYFRLSWLWHFWRLQAGYFVAFVVTLNLSLFMIPHLWQEYSRNDAVFLSLHFIKWCMIFMSLHYYWCSFYYVFPALLKYSWQIMGVPFILLRWYLSAFSTVKLIFSSLVINKHFLRRYFEII